MKPFFYIIDYVFFVEIQKLITVDNWNSFQIFILALKLLKKHTFHNFHYFNKSLSALSPTLDFVSNQTTLRAVASKCENNSVKLFQQSYIYFTNRIHKPHSIFKFKHLISSLSNKNSGTIRKDASNKSRTEIFPKVLN